MRKFLVLSATVLLTSSMAYAAGDHEGGHGHDEMAVGKPGTAAEVTRTVTVRMKETNDGEMLFDPAELDVRKGETVRFRVKNVGELEHEFVLDNHENIMEHKEAMQKMPEMEHDDPNSVRLDPGKDGEVIWTFANTGEFEFACLIPGHYESGMKGNLTVTKNQASN